VEDLGPDLGRHARSTGILFGGSQRKLKEWNWNERRNPSSQEEGGGASTFSAGGRFGIDGKEKGHRESKLTWAFDRFKGSSPALGAAENEAVCVCHDANHGNILPDGEESGG